jgi:2-polyprenyl-3-methyl-5-hydroxy-6-metoxy-1,4-benzoquinol methylase
LRKGEAATSEAEVKSMRKDTIQIEDIRLDGIDDIADYPDFHERHRVFPAVFEKRQHKKILDIAAGVGCAAQRIKEGYAADLLCNDINPTCLRILKKSGLTTVSFDLDDPDLTFPFPDRHFDAVVCLATIEHMIHTQHFIKEIHRILSDEGYLYLSAPNYSGLTYLFRFLLSGKTFHDPISKWPRERYEFYAHVRYFTYRSLVELVSAFGFVPDTVYLPLPEGSTHYQSLSKPKALTLRFTMMLVYRLFSPRWAAEPVICFRKGQGNGRTKIRKVIL